MHLLYENVQQERADKAVLEAIHRVNEADFIHNLGGKVLGVDADIQIRYRRIVKRKEGEKDNVTFEQFLEDSEREEEGKGGGAPNIRAVMEKADGIILNEGSLEDLHSQIDHFLEKIN
jgi:dephospho-CoA kinase